MSCWHLKQSGPRGREITQGRCLVSVFHEGVRPSGKKITDRMRPFSFALYGHIQSNWIFFNVSSKNTLILILPKLHIHNTVQWIMQSTQVYIQYHIIKITSSLLRKCSSVNILWNNPDFPCFVPLFSNRFDVSWHAQSIPNQYLINLNQVCWWGNLTNKWNGWGV